MIMVKKWLGVRNTVTTINTSESKVAKQLTGAILLLNTIRGGETTYVSEIQKECTVKIRMTWHVILILITYKVIILVAIILVVRLVKHIYRLCNFSKLQMPGIWVKQYCLSK